MSLKECRTFIPDSHVSIYTNARLDVDIYRYLDKSGHHFWEEIVKLESMIKIQAGYDVSAL
jgi:hypothetical protein